MLVLMPRSAALPLGGGSPALGFEPGRLRRPAGLGPLPLLGHHQGRGHHVPEPLGHFLAVSQLASGAARHQSQAAGAVEPWRQLCRSRSRWSAVGAAEPATSHQTSTRVEDVLTCWPPGPPEREARNSSSESGNAELRCDLECVISAMPKVYVGRSALSLRSASAATFLPMTDIRSCVHTCRHSAGWCWAIPVGWTPPLLAVAGTRALGPERFLAVIGRSASYPENQWRHRARDRPGVWRAAFESRDRELADPRYLGNSTDRCYFCKSELWTRLAEVAEELGFDTVIDGTNADDLGEHRPGLRAAAEHRGPLAARGARLEQGGGAGALAHSSACRPGMRRRRPVSRAG